MQHGNQENHGRGFGAQSPSWEASGRSTSHHSTSHLLTQGWVAISSRGSVATWISVPTCVRFDFVGMACRVRLLTCINPVFGTMPNRVPLNDKLGLKSIVISVPIFGKLLLLIVTQMLSIVITSRTHRPSCTRFSNYGKVWTRAFAVLIFHTNRLTDFGNCCLIYYICTEYVLKFCSEDFLSFGTPLWRKQ
jgi:hypothetical protein